MSQGATNENPQVIRIKSEIASLQDHLRRLVESGGKGEAGNPMPPTGKVPELTLEFVRRQREVKYHEALYQMLLQQFESAQLDESRSAPLVQIVDQKSSFARHQVLASTDDFRSTGHVPWRGPRNRVGGPAFNLETED